LYVLLTDIYLPEFDRSGDEADEEQDKPYLDEDDGDVDKRNTKLDFEGCSGDTSMIDSSLIDVGLSIGAGDGGESLKLVCVDIHA
jgi:hypothetical protein